MGLIFTGLCSSNLNSVLFTYTPTFQPLLQELTITRTEPVRQTLKNIFANSPKISGLIMAFLNTATSTSSSEEVVCFTDIKVGKQMVKFKLNTDAEK